MFPIIITNHWPGLNPQPLVNVIQLNHHGNHHHSPRDIELKCRGFYLIEKLKKAPLQTFLLIIHPRSLQSKVLKEFSMRADDADDVLMVNFIFPRRIKVIYQEEKPDY